MSFERAGNKGLKLLEFYQAILEMAFLPGLGDRKYESTKTLRLESSRGFDPRGGRQMVPKFAGYVAYMVDILVSVHVSMIHAGYNIRMARKLHGFGPGPCHLWALHQSRVGSHVHVHMLGKLCRVLKLLALKAVEAADNFELALPVGCCSSGAEMNFGH